MGRLFYFMSLFARPVLMTKAANEPVASRRKGGCVVQRTDDNNNDPSRNYRAGSNTTLHPSAAECNRKCPRFNRTVGPTVDKGRNVHRLQH